MKRGTWTTLELNKMATLYNEGLDIDDIAFRMERSKKSIENAVRNYRKTLKLEYRRDRPKLMNLLALSIELRLWATCRQNAADTALTAANSRCMLLGFAMHTLLLT